MGKNGYDTRYKYDYIFKTIIHDVNQLRNCVELYCTGEETNWATTSPGEASDGVNFRVLVNNSVNKGGQTVIICHYLWVRPYEYSYNPKVQDNPSGWSSMGMVEFWRMLKKNHPYVRKKIWKLQKASSFKASRQL